MRQNSRKQDIQIFIEPQREQTHMSKRRCSTTPAEETQSDSDALPQPRQMDSRLSRLQKLS